MLPPSPWPRPRAALVAAALALVAFPPVRPLRAQGDDPPRPKLKAPADTNSWQAYYKYGLSILGKRPGRAAEAFHWAARLDPARPEPLYAQWAATWMSKPEQFAEYFGGAEYYVNSAEVRHIDSLYYQAVLRNPFVHQGLERVMVAAMHNRKYGAGKWEWSDEPEDLAWLAYTEVRFDEAARLFGQALNERPKHPEAVRLARARSLVLAKQYDSAVAELQTLLETLRRGDRKQLVYFYDSKAMFEYSVAVAYTIKGDHGAAREAYGRALVEDLSFYRAHAGLAAAALAQGDTAAALTEYEQAVQLDATDAALRTDYGLVLVQRGRYADAVAELTAAAAAQPHYALPHFYLAHALDAQQQHAAAAPHYVTFLARASRDQTPQAEHARRRLEQLSASGVVPTGRR